jgi:hypothetical protein
VNEFGDWGKHYPTIVNSFIICILTTSIKQNSQKEFSKNFESLMKFYNSKLENNETNEFYHNYYLLYNFLKGTLSIEDMKKEIEREKDKLAARLHSWNLSIYALAFKNEAIFSEIKNQGHLAKRDYLFLEENYQMLTFKDFAKISYGFMNELIKYPILTKISKTNYMELILEKSI